MVRQKPEADFQPSGKNQWKKIAPTPSFY